MKFKIGDHVTSVSKLPSLSHLYHRHGIIYLILQNDTMYDYGVIFVDYPKNQWTYFYEKELLPLTTLKCPKYLQKNPTTISTHQNLK